ncbi:MAG: Rrf2 family transcriptional regulator [Ruminococcaceae bacterium]|nr:Rrf2 family transcriptional regulator [Oscillospiraceae bacterium]
MISTKGRYALRLMIDIAQNDSGSYIPLKDIAERQQISKKYLEIIVKDLVNAKLLKGVSGKGGGYKLAKKPEEYTVAEILEVSEGSLAVVACLEEGAETCPRAEICNTLPMWTEYNKMISDFFTSKKLSDLL